MDKFIEFTAMIAVFLLCGLVVQVLWNFIAVAAGLFTLTFGQGLALFVLCRLLFGGGKGGAKTD